ncbi:GTP 3',8-cyclase MoaA [Halanaerobium sp. MA284_MarDTE_T2]|uniref:GTP 3',8-cyclase MoaA n=1 Tax=Halanaerobium sp. MA284_MarDTE_T2 TaxID=2183913 RepID=UPI000DF28475|nr:GTP 3',8-cyclase MoaA [Halanaerobium sp. MA284_MarDTE_T2]RCW49681.1 cyclic pyranopterin monophosphate synthase subunit MoaA [Halanaerobium sp. MA284_MarDTE_T2]
MIKNDRLNGITYLRVSVTDRCNLRCKYCMPEEGVADKPHQKILSYEELEKIISVSAELGVTHIRLTGGEPLVRKDLDYFIKKIDEIEQIKDISITTNGVLLSKLGEKLKKAGLDRVNISLDTLDPDKFKFITRRENFSDVIAGIDTALALDLKPVKVNTVLMKDFNLDEVEEFIKFVKERDINLRFIEFMPVSGDSDHSKHFYPVEKVKKELVDKYRLHKVSMRGVGPSEDYTADGFKGSIGFIAALTHKFCGSCNRLRLTADGKLRVCLVSDKELILKKDGKLLEKDKLKEAFFKAVSCKPKGHDFLGANLDINNIKERKMFQIGG